MKNRVFQNLARRKDRVLRRLSAKPAKEDRHIVMAAAVPTPPGETAATKRTQGSTQAAGGFVHPQRLIQPRKQVGDADGDAFNVAEAGAKETPRRVSGGPSGSTKTVACVQGSELELGRPANLLGNEVGASNPKEAVPMGSWESDPPIVVRDGSAVHMAKGRAGEQRWQSTHAGATNAPHPCVSRSLSAKRRKPVTNPNPRFVSRSSPRARPPDEPGAGILHAGICEGTAGQPAALP